MASTRIATNAAVTTRWTTTLIVVWLVYVVAVWSAAALAARYQAPNDRRGAGTAAERLASWDGTHYSVIAANGYWTETTESPRARHVAFFPLFPLAARAFGGVSHFTIAGILLSQLLLLGSILMLGELRSVSGHARSSLLTEPGFWLLLSPLAFFCAVFYAESMYLFLSLAAFLAYRRQRFGLAAFAAFLLGLTRPTGVCLSFLFAIEAFIAWRKERLLWPALVCFSAPVVGMCLYVAWVGYSFRDPLAYFQVNSKWWGQEWVGPFWLDAKDLIKTVIASVSGAQRTADQNLRLGSTIANVGLLAWGWRRLPPPLIGYFALSLLFIHVQVPHISTARRELMLFPAFLLLAEWVAYLPASTQRWLPVGMAGAATVLQLRFLYDFLCFRWVA